MTSFHTSSTPHRALRCVRFALVAVSVSAAGTSAQELTVERILGDSMTATEPNVRFAPDGRTLVSLVRNGSLLDVWAERPGAGEPERWIDGTTLVPPGAEGPVIIEDVTWSTDLKRALIYTGSQRVWRQNTKGVYYVWDRAASRLTPVSSASGLQQFARFSPDGGQVAFVRNNDIWVADPLARRELQITRDGSDDIINGAADWVYEEELGVRDAFRWSPDGRRIAFWRFDQSAIRAFDLLDEDSLYPLARPVRYPKAGTPNSAVELRIVDIASGRNIRIDAGSGDDYLVRMDWIDDASLSVQRLNRAQNRIDLLLVDAATGRTRPLIAETDSAWVDIDDDLTWIRNGRQFLWTSERSGFNHIHLFNRDGSAVRQLTRGDWDVDRIVGIDESAGRIYFTARERGPLEKHLYAVGIDGRGFRRISADSGTHEITMAPGARFYLDSWSRAGTAPVTRLHTADGRILRSVSDNALLARSLASLGNTTPEFFAFQTSDGVSLNGWMLKPPDFDPARRYPVVFYVYGGPGSQTVTDAWGGVRYLWHLLLARRGFVVASIDNRGTGARGRDFERTVRRDLGRWESHDQIEAARYFANQPWADPGRFAIWGWSYGGFATLLTLINGDTFRAGIAVAPVTDWRLYDSAYTERYMGMPADNPAGYERSSAIANAGRLHGRLLLIHGTGDDNVHFQNSVRFAQALQRAGTTFDLMIYPNRTHSLSGGTVPTHLYRTMTEFLVRELSSR